ncbi:hypothetical protein [Streptomyces sp. NPDC053542]
MRSKNYWYLTNRQVVIDVGTRLVIDAGTRLVFAVAPPVTGHHK